MKTNLGQIKGGRIGGRASSPAKTKANREKAREYWAAVAAGVVVHRGRGKARKSSIKSKRKII